MHRHVWHLPGKSIKTFTARFPFGRPRITLVPCFAFRHGYAGVGDHFFICSRTGLHGWDALCAILFGLTHCHDRAFGHLHSELLPTESLHSLSIFRTTI